MPTNKNSNTGLSSREVQARLKKYGYNETPQKREFTALRIIFSQFTSFLIIVLIIAGVVSIYAHEVVDGIAILVIVVINAIIGFIQEYKAENAVKALKKMVVPVSIVIRNGQQQEVAMRDLVPDDIVILAEGDKVPADLKILKSFSLKADEAMLTGESVPANKDVGEGKEGLLYKGTIITTGRAVGKVIATGVHTEFGKIIDLVSKQNHTASPLSLQLDELGKKLGLIIIILIGILFAMGYFRGVPAIEMLMTSVALGVSAIPEGMPIIVTLTLALGVQTLARKKAIVRKMNAIETLGATTIICSDKTGTLTLNEMTVKKIFTNFKEREIAGTGYTWEEKIRGLSIEEKKLMEICENCNNSFVGKNILGDPTEIALKVLTRKADYTKEYKELDENTFTSERKMMSSLHRVGRTNEVYAKGAFEEILKRSTHVLKNGKVRPITPSDKKAIKSQADKYSRNALRVLGFAYKPSTTLTETNLIFTGLVGMMDPPRDTVTTSIAIAHKAGIAVKIITGDNPITAAAIGKRIGIDTKKILTGDQIDKMSDRELKKAIYQTQIFARTKPEHKYRIVDILKRNHEIVAVTGDGVNDAPALKHADVGIAMGIKGTEATKEVADIVLKDDNFTTIVRTIKEGRRIYHNILAFIKYMLSANFETLMVVGIITIAGYPLPILPLQILWLNIATDALPALALGNSPAEKGIMNLPPHPKKENIILKFLPFLLTATAVQTVINVSLYFYGLQTSIELARTFVFTQTVLFELVFAFVCKQESRPTLKSFFNNKQLIGAVTISFLAQLIMIYAPFMQNIFNTVPLTITQWLLLLAGACSAFVIPSITNLFRRKKL